MGRTGAAGNPVTSGHGRGPRMMFRRSASGSEKPRGRWWQSVCDRVLSRGTRSLSVSGPTAPDSTTFVDTNPGRMLEEKSRLGSELAGASEQAGETDARYVEEERGDDVPEGLRRRQDRLVAIRRAKGALGG